MCLLRFSIFYAKVNIRTQALTWHKFRTWGDLRGCLLQSFPLAGGGTEIQVLVTWPKPQSSWGTDVSQKLRPRDHSTHSGHLLNWKAEKPPPSVEAPQWLWCFEKTSPLRPLSSSPTPVDLRVTTHAPFSSSRRVTLPLHLAPASVHAAKLAWLSTVSKTFPQALFHDFLITFCTFSRSYL